MDNDYEVQPLAPLAPLFIVVPQPLPPYIKTYPNYIHKYDRHYAKLLLNSDIKNHVILHDETFTHTPTASPDSYRGMSKYSIQDLFQRVHEYQHGMDIIETILHNKALEEGFVVMLDDWYHPWIYVHDEIRYNEWVENGEENGLFSYELFQ